MIYIVSMSCSCAGNQRGRGFIHGWAIWLPSNSLGYLVTIFFKQKCKNMARRVDSIKEEIQELKKKLTLLGDFSKDIYVCLILSFTQMETNEHILRTHNGRWKRIDHVYSN